MDETLTSTQIVSDLVRIHADRIEEYRHLLHEPNMALDVKSIFEHGSSTQSVRYSQQLKENVQVSPEGHGSIYKLWLSGKEPVADKNKKMRSSHLCDG